MDFSPERVHGPWQESKQAVQQWLDGVLPEAEMDRMLQATHTAAISPAKAVLKGQGWGALDNLMQESRGASRWPLTLTSAGWSPRSKCGIVS